jgi:hypothetical protein
MLEFYFQYSFRADEDRRWKSTGIVLVESRAACDGILKRKAVRYINEIISEYR